MRKREVLAALLVFAVVAPIPAVVAYYSHYLFLPRDHISVTARQYEFEPNEIVVTKGEVVRLLITSEDVVHGFKILGYDVMEDFYPGVPAKIEFVADRAGEFVFICDVYCDEGHWDMKGKFIVQDTVPPGSLQAFVKDAGSNPIVNATVTISGPVNKNGLTDSSGQFVFSNILSGNYLITASKSGYASSTTTATVSSQETTIITVVLTQSLQVREFHIDAWVQEDGGFVVLESPDYKTIKVNKGDTVRLIITAKDTAHGLGLDEFGVDTGEIAEGTIKTVEFVASLAGTFTYQCTVWCSAKHPTQKGTLVVQP